MSDAERIAALEARLAAAEARIAALEAPAPRRVAEPGQGNPWVVDRTVMPTNHYDRCPCNPLRGGSGVCGCVLGGMQVTS